MGTRGRRSTAELTVVQGGMVNRPPPPRELDAAEAVEWCAIVAAMPMGHFARSHQPLLVQLCRYIVETRYTAQLLAACRKKRKGNSREYGALLSRQVRETAMIMRLQKTMRLTQSSIMERTAVKKLRPVQNSNGKGDESWAGA